MSAELYIEISRYIGIRHELYIKSARYLHLLRQITEHHCNTLQHFWRSLQHTAIDLKITATHSATDYYARTETLKKT